MHFGHDLALQCRRLEQQAKDRAHAEKKLQAEIDTKVRCGRMHLMKCILWTLVRAAVDEPHRTWLGKAFKA